MPNPIKHSFTLDVCDGHATLWDNSDPDGLPIADGNGLSNDAAIRDLFDKIHVQTYEGADL